MRVLTAKEVNFVSGGSIDGDQFSDPWVLSGDGSSGSCSSSSSDASCSSSSVSHCQTPAVDGGNGGYLGTGMPCTSGNSIGDVNYTPPTQEESCENAVEAGVVGACPCHLKCSYGKYRRNGRRSSWCCLVCCE